MALFTMVAIATTIISLISRERTKPGESHSARPGVNCPFQNHREGSYRPAARWSRNAYTGLNCGIVCGDK